MENEKKDPIITDGKSEDSSQPTDTGESVSSPDDVSIGKEVEELRKDNEKLKKSYSESSSEAKRLKTLNDEAEENLQEKEDYIQSLEKAFDEEKEHEKKDIVEEPKKEEKNEEKEPEKKKELPPHLTEEGQKRAMKKLLNQDKADNEEVTKRYDAALEEFPRLKNKTFAKLVSQKMKIDKVNVKDACKTVAEDLKELGDNEGDDEPFVEGGTGKSTTKTEETVGDKIRKSLTRDETASYLPGMM